MSIESIFTKKTLYKKPERFRIEAIASDGMWYSIGKWRKMARVDESTLKSYIDEALADGTIVRSPTGAQSYRMPVESIAAWYEENGFSLTSDVQLLDFVFPPRIWDGITEPEGFLQAPVREVAMVSFVAIPEIAHKVADELRGIARVREEETGKYKAYGLNATYIKDIVSQVIERENSRYERGREPFSKVYSRQVSTRREMVDFGAEFAKQLVLFYRNFGKSLVKSSSKTIDIFIPNPEEQDAQILTWVLEAIEKFDESASVPFSGYLDTVLKRWPYNLPGEYLGKELSVFQKGRARAISELKADSGEDEKSFSNQEIAEKMGVDMEYFADLEEKHRAWVGVKNAESLVWDNRNEEKQPSENFSSSTSPQSTPISNKRVCSSISRAAIEAALETGDFADCWRVTHFIDSGEKQGQVISSLSPRYVSRLGGNIEKATADLKKSEGQN